MKPILFATNYSISSEKAGDYAAQLAKLCNAPLIVLHSWTLPILTPEDAVLATPTETYHERERLAIDKEVMRLRTRWGIQVTGVECQGFTADEIEHLFKHQEVSLVVMGMHYHNLYSRLLGSVATSAIHRAGYSVLLIPDTVQFSRPFKILLAAASDFSSYSKSLNPLKLFVRTMSTSLDIVHVLKPEEIWAVNETDKTINLEYLLRQIPHEWIIEHDENITRGIMRSSDKVKADWIAIVPRHFSWLETLLHRSISENLAFSSTKPLLILPAESTDTHFKTHKTNSTITL